MRKVFAAVLLSGCLSGISTAAELELTNTEKIIIIEEIAAQKIKEAQGGNVSLAEVLTAVGQKFPLDPVPASGLAVVIEKLKQQVKQKYPASDAELEEKYRPEAETLYPFPVYKQGDEVIVTYYVYDKPFQFSGIYYKSDSEYVWVGARKISLKTISPEDAPRFDVKSAESKRQQYIREKIAKYHRVRREYERQLMTDFRDNIEFLCNKLKVGDKWLSARSVVEQKFKEAVDLQNREIAQSVQRSKQYKSISNLEYLIGQYPNHPDKNEWVELLISYKIQKAKNTKAYQQKFQILESLMSQYPNHPEKNKWLELLISYKIQMAKDTKSYQQKLDILESIIRDYPNHEICRDAEALLKQYKGEYLLRMIFGIVLIVGICVSLSGLFIFFYLKKNWSTIKERLKMEKT